MRSGITLATLRKEVMIEAGLSSQSGHASYSTERLNQMLNRSERLLLLEAEWPEQHIEREISVAAEAQYVDLPADLTFTEIESVHVNYGSDWLKVGYGIGPRERTVYNDTQRAAPIMRYETNADNPGRIEVWPIASQVQTLLLEGTKTVGTMSAEDDTCTLDGDILVFRVAAQILGRNNQADAEMLLGMAQSKLEKLMKAQGGTKRGNFNLGRPKGKIMRPGIDYIPPGSNM